MTNPDPVAEAERALDLSLRDMVVAAGPHAGLHTLSERAKALTRRYAAAVLEEATEEADSWAGSQPPPRDKMFCARREALEKEAAGA